MFLVFVEHLGTENTTPKFCHSRLERSCGGYRASGLALFLGLQEMGVSGDLLPLICNPDCVPL